MYWELDNTFTSKNILAANGRHLTFPRSLKLLKNHLLDISKD